MVALMIKSRKSGLACRELALHRRQQQLEVNIQQHLAPYLVFFPLHQVRDQSVKNSFKRTHTPN